MRALVLSGGSSKGAYQSGALRHLLHDLKIHYDILCGVSVGALNCSLLSMFNKGEESEASDLLLKIWNELDSSKIYKRWFPFGRFHALWNKSFYDSSPMHNLIVNSLDLEKIRSTKRKIAVGTVSLSSGKYTIFTQDSDFFIKAVIASASFPGMFTPVKFMGQLWTDGGIKEISPIKQAIDMGANEIDVIITSPEVRVKRFIGNPTTVDILNRVIDLSTDKIMANDIEKVHMYNKLASAGLTDKQFVKINILRPDYNLIEDLLDFSPAKIKEMIQKGYNDAKYKFIM